MQIYPSIRYIDGIELSQLQCCKGLHAIAARLCTSVRRWMGGDRVPWADEQVQYWKAQSSMFPQKLNSSFSEDDAGQLHRTFSLTEKLVLPKACIVRSACHFCQRQVQSHYLPLVKVFTTNRSFTRLSLPSAKDLLFSYTPSHQLAFAATSLKSLFLFLLRSPMLCISFHRN